METKPLAGKAALVTGSDRGVGKGIALELAGAGAHIAVNYFDDPRLATATVAELESTGVKAFAVQGDVRMPAQVRDMFAKVIDRFGRLDVHVNNAGVQTWKRLLDVEEDEWDLVVDTNLKGCFLCTQAAARYMKDHGGGSIVNIGSGCNKVAFPELVAYTASKGGIEMFTKVAAVELGPHGIRVNCVAPGAVEVERTRLEDPDYAGTWGRITPLGRVGQPADIGRVVAFLATPQAAFVTGQTIWVDGGMYARAPWAYKDATK
jgi:NAD(P)-dependent dehydrogenase (short-subunit alcohol dehydrogenase family)